MAKYDEKGREIPDQTPVEVPVHLKRPLTLREEMQRMIRTEMSREAADRGEETFEEADDFEVDDDAEYHSPYEMTEMQEEFRIEKQSIDEQKKEEENSGTVNNDRITGDDDGRRNGAGSKGEGLEAERGGEAAAPDGPGDVRKEHAAPGGEGRSTAKRGGRVPKGRSAD